MSLFKLIMLTGCCLWISACLFSTSVQAQEVTVFNGFFKENYFIDQEKVAKDTVVELMQEEPITRKEWKKHRRSNRMVLPGLALQIGGLSLFTQNIFGEDVSESKNRLAMGSFLLGTLGGTAFSWKGQKHKRQAILEYNEALEEDKSNEEALVE